MYTISNNKVNNVNSYVFGLIIILVNNLCFYTSESIVLYIVLSGIGMFLIWFLYLTERQFKIVMCKYVYWITLVFAMFTVYGTIFLKKGIYNWDKMLFSYVQIITLYICFKKVAQMEKWWRYLYKAFSISLVITIFYLIVKEGSLILSDISRIGFSLSGDVNVVADCMGILLILVFYYYLQEKSKFAAILTMFVLVFMFLTGSKRIAFVIIILLIMVWPYAKKKLNVLLIVSLVFLVGLYLVFESSFFYNLIGYRFVDMYLQLIGQGSTAYYTSTNARFGMIIEGFKVFLSKPVFGGGMGYYSSQSTTWGYYNYSHCNYVEMLCTFGVVGTFVFYSSYFYIIKVIRNRRNEIDGSFVVICMLALMLLIDWVAVSFLDSCIYYLPITLSFAIVEKNRVHSNIN